MSRKVQLRLFILDFVFTYNAIYLLIITVFRFIFIFLNFNRYYDHCAQQWDEYRLGLLLYIYYYDRIVSMEDQLCS